MLEVIKPLLDSDLVNEETRKQITEAWDTKLEEIREEVRQDLREEFAGRYEHDKHTMVEALDKMVTEHLSAEISQVIAEKKALAEDRVKFNTKMTESAEKFDSFMVKKLAEEIQELRKDRTSQSATMEKLEKFVIESLASEITEFHKDKKDVVETKVKLVAEAKDQLDALKKKFIEKSSKLVKEAVTGTLREELTQLKEDIKQARENNFGRKLFETFAAEYSTSYLNENQEMKGLEAVIVNKDKQLKEATKKLETSTTEVDAQKAKIERINEGIKRKEKLNELMKPLANKQADVMQSLLESVTTDKLKSAYDKYLPAVLKNEAPKKEILAETRKEVTGNKTIKSQSMDEDNIVLLQKLAGM
tara:strand:- start:143 stop:1225 length:1083 start_codon:yes stop_codon:yes gene_type:complete